MHDKQDRIQAMPRRKSRKGIPFSAYALAFYWFGGLLAVQADPSVDPRFALQLKRQDDRLEREMNSPAMKRRLKIERQGQQASHPHVVPAFRVIPAGGLARMKMEREIENPKIQAGMNDCIHAFQASSLSQMKKAQKQMASMTVDSYIQKSNLNELFSDPQARNTPAVRQLKAQLPAAVDQFHALGKILQGPASAKSGKAGDE